MTREARDLLALTQADWPKAAAIHRQRFIAALDSNDEEEAAEALASALISERMCEMCEQVTAA